VACVREDASPNEVPFINGANLTPRPCAHANWRTLHTDPVRRLLDDRNDVPGFLAAWYGPPDRPAAAPPADPDGLPPALRQWYATTARWTRPLLFNHKVSPMDGLYETEGLLAFCMDDFEWQEFAVAPGAEDPVVHRREIGGDAGWEPHDALRLSQFLPALLLHETVQGAPYGAAADGLTPDQRDRLLAPLRRLPGPDLFTEQYAGEGLLAIAWPQEDTWEVRLAARDSALPLRYAEAVPGVEFGPGEWCPVEESR
jgi:hypothetical protein